MKKNRWQSWLPPFVLPASVSAFVTLGWGPNMALASFSLLILIAGIALLWRPGETPILLYLFAFQWLEASTAIFYANFQGIDIDQIAYTGANMQLATVLSLTGLLALAAGLRSAVGPMRSSNARLVRFQVERISQRTWLILYIAVLLLATAAQAMALVVPGLSQPLLALANFKWAAFVMFTISTFARPDASRTIWFVVLVLEFYLGLGGYFSGFKFVFIFALIGIVASDIRFSLPQIIKIGAIVGVLFTLGVVWTAIKTDYRAFVRADQIGQIVTVDKEQQVGKIVELAADLDASQLQDGLDGLVRRLTYVEFFGVVTNNVPSVMPHEGGALWLDAITRPFMPRILFPEKAVIDESALTNEYTDLGVSGMDEGTQISIGYMGESYIDFGKYGMMVAVFIWGFFLGKIYLWLVGSRHTRGLLGTGLASAILIGASSIGNSTAKLFGAMVVSLLVVWILNRVVVPIFLPWLRA